MKYFVIILLLVFAVSLTATNVFAELLVEERLFVISDTSTPIFEFRDQGSKAYFFQIPDGSKRLEIYDAQAGLARVSIANWGGVGIGTQFPSELLDVAGNIKLSGNIVSDGDICIGSCP